MILLFLLKVRTNMFHRKFNNDSKMLSMTHEILPNVSSFSFNKEEVANVASVKVVKYFAFSETGATYLLAIGARAGGQR